MDPPVAVRLITLPDVACPYLPGRVETLRAINASRIDGDTYRAFMDTGFRRSGRMLYQPVCRACHECRPIRVPTATFTPNATQRRCARRNADLTVAVGVPELTDEKLEMYGRYVREWHDKPDEADPAAVRQFLYDSPTDTLEFVYRNRSGRLIAVGLCDLSSTSLSSVYFYFDPADAARSPGTFGAVHEIAWAAARGCRTTTWDTGCVTAARCRTRPTFVPPKCLAWRAPGNELSSVRACCVPGLSRRAPFSLYSPVR